MCPRLTLNFVYNREWLWTSDLASTSPALGLQMYSTMLRFFSTGDGAQGFVRVVKELYKLNCSLSPLSIPLCLLFLSLPTVTKLSLNIRRMERLLRQHHWISPQGFLTQKTRLGPRACISTKSASDAIAAGPQGSHFKSPWHTERRDQKRDLDRTSMENHCVWGGRRRKETVALDTEVSSFWGHFHQLLPALRPCLVSVALFCELLGISTSQQPLFEGFVRGHLRVPALGFRMKYVLLCSASVLAPLLPFLDSLLWTLWPAW